MTKQTPNISSLVSLFGAILIFANTMLVAASGVPIIVSSYPVSSVNDLTTSGNPFWGRIALGVRGFVEGPLMLFWITLSTINLFLSVLLYLKTGKPEMPSFFIIVFSILSIFTGGGFIIGLVLGVIGCGMGLQSRKILTETFFGKLLGAARLDSKLYKLVKEDPRTLGEAALAIIFVNILSGLGSGLYLFNADKILNSSSSDAPFKILLLGQVFFDTSVLTSPLINISIAIFKWLILSLIIYLVGVKLASLRSEFDGIARSIAFAYAPIGLQVFVPLVFSNQPFLTSQWPMAIFLITNFWMIFALVVAVKQSMNLSIGKAMGLVMLTGTIYWLIIYKMIFPVAHLSGFDIPGIQFDLQPMELVLALASLSVILSILLGVFKRR